MEGRRSSASETLHFNINIFLVISDFSGFKIKIVPNTLGTGIYLSALNIKKKIKLIIIEFYVSVLLEQRKSISCSKNAFSFFDLKLDTLLQVIWRKLHSVTKPLK